MIVTPQQGFKPPTIISDSPTRAPDCEFPTSTSKDLLIGARRKFVVDVVDLYHSRCSHAIHIWDTRSRRPLATISNMILTYWRCTVRTTYTCAGTYNTRTRMVVNRTELDGLPLAPHRCLVPCRLGVFAELVTLLDGDYGRECTSRLQSVIFARDSRAARLGQSGRRWLSVAQAVVKA
ncbi:hypothetical protein K523DRAFT_403861 [Schizophyllum commune Tattone D]|nr:hypothetical protein K523DRAFT_403861 [Schizophyllum commune Tattone D]